MIQIMFKQMIKGEVILNLERKKITLMSFKITDDCINCGACETECPNHAIYKNAENWSISDGNLLSGEITFPIGITFDAEMRYQALTNDYFFIVPYKCTECEGFYKEAQCAAVCPVDCCVKDEANFESVEMLMAKKKLLHN